MGGNTFKGASYVQNHPSFLSHGEMLHSFPLGQRQAAIRLMPEPEGHLPSAADACVCLRAGQLWRGAAWCPTLRNTPVLAAPSQEPQDQCPKCTRSGSAEAACRPSQCLPWQEEITGTVLSGLDVNQQISVRADLGFFKFIMPRLRLGLCCQWYCD